MAIYDRNGIYVGGGRLAEMRERLVRDFERTGEFPRNPLDQDVLLRITTGKVILENRQLGSAILVAGGPKAGLEEYDAAKYISGGILDGRKRDALLAVARDQVFASNRSFLLYMALRLEADERRNYSDEHIEPVSNYFSGLWSERAETRQNLVVALSAAFDEHRQPYISAVLKGFGPETLQYVSAVDRELLRPHVRYNLDTLVRELSSQP